MIDELLRSKIAIVGGGRFCKNMIELLHSEDFEDQRLSILGVADQDDQAKGLLYAASKGIFTTSDYRELFELEDLQIIMELTVDDKLGMIINMTKPHNVRLIDHVESRTIWTSLRVEAEKRKALKALGRHKDITRDINALFEKFADRLGDVIRRRSNRYVEIER